MDDAQQFAPAGHGPDMSDAIAGAGREQRAGGVEGHGNGRIVVQRNALRVAGEFDVGRGLFVRLEKSDRFVVHNINELGGTVIARNGEDGAVGRKCHVANTFGWVRVFWCVQLRACRQKRNRRPQRLISFEGRIEAVRFDSQKRGLASSIRTIGEDFGRVRGEAGGEILDRFFVAHASLTQCEECDQKNGDKAGGGEQAGLPPVANIRTVEFVFGPIVQRSSELEDGFVKARLAHAEAGGAVACPAKIEEKRLLGKGSEKACRESVGVLRRERGGEMIPLQSAASKDNQDARRARFCRSNIRPPSQPRARRPPPAKQAE